MANTTLQLVLVGGGHGHLHILKQLQRTKLPHTQVILVSTSRFQYYSGMFSGYVAGNYSLDEIRIDLESLAQRAGASFVHGTAEHVDPDANQLYLEQDSPLPFDVISFDVGSLTGGVDIPGVMQFSRMIKPNYLLPEILAPLKTKQDVVVVGGGAAGVEMSLALQSWRRRNQIPGPIQLVSSGPLLEREGRRISKRIQDIVEMKGVRLHAHQLVQEVQNGRAITSTGTIPFEELLWLAGPLPHKIFRTSGVAVDYKGYMMVKGTLQSLNYPHVFGLGDCATLESHPELPKSGVYAVRQAPTLWANLKRYIEGTSLVPYHPQRRNLSILLTDARQAFLMYGGLSLHGCAVWHLKHRIDTHFVKQYQR